MVILCKAATMVLLIYLSSVLALPTSDIVARLQPCGNKTPK